MTQARIHVQVHHPNGETVRLQLPEHAIIGRSGQAEIHLNSWRVAKEHARLVATPAGVLIEDMGAFGGVAVNGRRIEVQYGPLKATDDITVGPFRLRARLGDGLDFAASAPVHFRYGERLRVILHNDTMMTHPMHLHGMWQELENASGDFVARLHTIPVQPAQRLSFLVTADALGRWVWHCHLMFHMEMGMFREVVVA